MLVAWPISQSFGELRHRLSRLRGGCWRRGVAFDHRDAELGELPVIPRRAGVMLGDAAMLGREAERQCDIEIRQRFHLAIEPSQGIRPEAVSPGQAGAQMPPPQTLQPNHRLVETMVLEMKPLTYAELRRVAREILDGAFR